MFIPGETISHQFYIPFIRADVEKIIVSYKQHDHVILERTVYGGQLREEDTKSTFAITLSQEESLLFEDDKKYKVQLNVFFNGGARCASVELCRETGVQHIREVVDSNG